MLCITFVASKFAHIPTNEVQSLNSWLLLFTLKDSFDQGPCSGFDNGVQNLHERLFNQCYFKFDGQRTLYCSVLLQDSEMGSEASLFRFLDVPRPTVPTPPLLLLLTKIVKTHSIDFWRKAFQILAIRTLQNFRVRSLPNESCYEMRQK